MSMTSTQTWQPIETAPRDGTGILLLHGGSYEVAQWLDSLPSNVEFAESKLSGWGRIYGPQLSCIFSQNAEYWMPLPPPPSEKLLPDSA